MADTNKAPNTNLSIITNGASISSPFVWVNTKGDVFESVSKETEGDNTSEPKYTYNTYTYTGALKKTYSDYNHSVIFIEDSNEIWAGGQFFGLSAESVRVINDNFNALNTSVITLNTAYGWVKNFNGTYVSKNDVKAATTNNKAAITYSNDKYITFTGTGGLAITQSGNDINFSYTLTVSNTNNSITGSSTHIATVGGQNINAKIETATTDVIGGIKGKDVGSAASDPNKSHVAYVQICTTSDNNGTAYVTYYDTDTYRIIKYKAYGQSSETELLGNNTTEFVVNSIDPHIVLSTTSSKLNIGWTNTFTDDDKDNITYATKADLANAIASGVIYKGHAESIPSVDVGIGAMYVWNGTEPTTLNGETLNKGDILISYSPTHTDNTGWAVVEHNIDNSFAQDAVDIKQNTVPALDGTVKTIFTYKVGDTDTNIQAKIATATTDVIGGIKGAVPTTKVHGDDNIIASGAAAATDTTPGSKIAPVQIGANGIAYVTYYQSGDTNTVTEINTVIGGGKAAANKVVTGLSISKSGNSYKLNATYTVWPTYTWINDAGYLQSHQSIAGIIGNTANSTDSQETTTTHLNILAGGVVKSSIKITGENAVEVSYTTTNGLKISSPNLSHGTSTHNTSWTDSTTTGRDINEAITGFTVSNHTIYPTYSYIASYTYIESRYALKWVVI